MFPPVAEGCRRLAGGLLLFFLTTSVGARDLPEIRAAGALRHLGIPYVNLVTGGGDGLDVEAMRGFAAHLGARYEFVASDWPVAFGDLTGRHPPRGEHGAELLDTMPIKGDLIANRVTILPWRGDAAETTLLDVPDALIALEKWPGQLKVIGPVSEQQEMAVAFRKSSPRPRQAFNDYLDGIRHDGSYARLARRYYPSVSLYYADFFAN